MRLFALVGALLVAGGVYLLIDGGLRLARAIEDESISARVWAPAFWLASPDEPGFELATNARWLLRLVVGLVSVLLGGKIVRVATR